MPEVAPVMTQVLPSIVPKKRCRAQYTGPDRRWKAWLPRVGGIEVLRRVREARPAARVLVLSIYPEEQYALQLIHAGAAAYLSRASPPEALLDAIRRVAAGDTAASPAALRKVVVARAPGL